VVGVVGGGQLARMMQQAAIALDVRLRLLAAASGESAARVVPDTSVGDPNDASVLRSFAAGCDVLTFDHEQVPNAHLRVLEAEGTRVRPGAGALLHAQDKAAMRERLGAAELPVPRWRRVKAVDDITEFAADAGWPVVLKATRGGYDGRGVWPVADRDQAATVADECAQRGVHLIAEQRVAFTRELAALVARSPHGQAVAYPVVETVQRGGICHELVAPAPGLGEVAATAAQAVALRVAEQLDVTGVMAVELFDTPAGVVVNELAMRPHNSGHWTIDGAVTSQFEQHLRAVLDLPLGSPAPVAPWTVTVNVLGGDYPDLHRGLLHCMARDPGLRVHLYGKQVRPGRKVGHVSVTGSDLDELRARARHAADFLRGALHDG
jgi:5-(carboxyamino)imidazole ribonucleotide synthase